MSARRVGKAEMMDAGQVPAPFPPHTLDRHPAVASARRTTPASPLETTAGFAIRLLAQGADARGVVGSASDGSTRGSQFRPQVAGVPAELKTSSVRDVLPFLLVQALHRFRLPRPV